jgi:CheY-like chemotaxis protein
MAPKRSVAPSQNERTGELGQAATEGARHVLVVDDDKELRAVMRMLLEEEGYVVDEAADGTHALERLRESAEGMMVLLDANMPGMDGLQMLRTVADHPPLATRHAYVLVTALDGDLSATSVDFLQGLGIPIIGKPFNIDELMAAVEEAMRRLEGSSREDAERGRS